MPNVGDVEHSFLLRGTTQAEIYEGGQQREIHGLKGGIILPCISIEMGRSMTRQCRFCWEAAALAA